MKEYYGTKKIQAQPETRDGKYGYKVVYPDGYESWCPQDVFHLVYRSSGTMNFGHALMALKDGKKVARTGWNGKDMCVILIPGTPEALLNEGMPYAEATGNTVVTIRPHLDMKCADGSMQPGWLASQSDMLADDWFIVE